MKLSRPTVHQAQEGRRRMRARCMAIACAETPASVRYVKVRRSLSGCAWAVDKHTAAFAAPRPVTRRALYVFLHEVAHVVLGHIHGSDRKLKAWQREQQAEDWARDRMRAHGMPVPHKSTRQARAYVAHKKRIGESISRSRRKED